MLKVTVLGLSGCHWCRALTGELDELKTPYSFMNVNDNSALADYTEALLDTQEYPIVIISDDTRILYYIYRPSNHLGLKSSKTSDNNHKIGCTTIDSMLLTLEEILIKY